MAAVLIPRTADLQAPARRPQLHLVPGPGDRPGDRAPGTPSAAHRATHRRRRLAATLLAATLLVAVGVSLGRAGAAPSGATVATVASAGAAVAIPPGTDAAVGPAVYVVRPGDTLWGIARQLQPEGDIRPLVDTLSARAGGAGIQVGQRLVLDGLVG